MSTTQAINFSPVSLTPLINIHSRISPRIYEKNLKANISCQTPFKDERRSTYRRRRPRALGIIICKGLRGLRGAGEEIFDADDSVTHHLGLPDEPWLDFTAC